MEGASEGIGTSTTGEHGHRPNCKTPMPAITRSLEIEMRYMPDYSDERLKGACPQCGGGAGDNGSSSDHVPSRSLLRKPYPNELPTMPTCHDCNNSFSKDEEYLFLFLQCVLLGSTDPSEHRDGKTRRALRRHGSLRSRIERSKTQVAIDEETILVWMPEEDRVNRVVLKNARGHVYYEIGQPVLHEPDNVWAKPLALMTPDERRLYEEVTGLGAWPEVGSRMMTRLVTGEGLRNGWIVVQDGVYRYRVEQADGFLVRAVLHEYLATEVYWDDEGL